MVGVAVLVATGATGEGMGMEGGEVAVVMAAVARGPAGGAVVLPAA